MSVRLAKTQISLGIRPVWSESSLSAWRNLGSLATHWVHSEGSDQTGWMPRLIWIYAGRTLTLLVLSCRGSSVGMQLSKYEQNPECNWSAWWSPNHSKEMETQMVWPHLKILWHGEDNSSGDSERSKKERKTEEMGRQHQGMDGNGVWRFPEGSGRQGRVERYCCKIICGAPMTSKVKGLRWDDEWENKQLEQKE